MTKTFCDICGEQVGEYIEFEDMHNALYQVCRYCASSCEIAYREYCKKKDAVAINPLEEKEA